MRLAVALAGIVSGAAAQNRSEELLAAVADKAHSFPADMTGDKSGACSPPVSVLCIAKLGHPPGRKKCPDRPERNVIICRGAFGRGGRFAPGFAPNATALDSEVVAAPGRVEAVPRRWT